MWFSLYLRGLCFYGPSWSALHRPWPSHLSLQHLALAWLKKLTEYLSVFEQETRSEKDFRNSCFRAHLQAFTACLCQFNWQHCSEEMTFKGVLNLFYLFFFCYLSRRLWMDIVAIVNIIHFKTDFRELNVYSCCIINDYNLTLLHWSRVLLARKSTPEMWLHRGAPAAGADREWVSVVSFSLTGCLQKEQYVV